MKPSGSTDKPVKTFLKQSVVRTEEACEKSYSENRAETIMSEDEKTVNYQNSQHPLPTVTEVQHPGSDITSADANAVPRQLGAAAFFFSLCGRPDRVRPRRICWRFASCGHGPTPRRHFTQAQAPEGRKCWLYREGLRKTSQRIMSIGVPSTWRSRPPKPQ